MVSVNEMVEEIKTEQQNDKNRGAWYRKCVFHIHTPASYDYGLFKKGDIPKITINEIKKVLLEKGFPEPYITQNAFDNLIKNYDGVYKDSKEFALYLLIAFTLLKNQVELAVVNDHHNISGISKLKYAIKQLYKDHNIHTPFYTQILPGIEISCSDKNHVAAIFDWKDDKIKNFYDELKQTLVNEKEGTYEPSLHVLEKVREYDGIGYIAHINTSDIFKKTLTGAYKQKLFNSTKEVLVGLSDPDKFEQIENSINNFKSNNISLKYLYDEDSHVIEELAYKSMWIKGKSIDFQMLINALNDYSSSIFIDKPERPETYISALYIEGKGFLKGKETDHVVFKFSDRMNAFIGGRGSGKSSILTCLDYLTSQQVDNDSVLRNIFSQGSILVEYIFKGTTYYISSLGGDVDLSEIEYASTNFRDDFELRTEPKKRFKRKEAIKDSIQLWMSSDKDIHEIKTKKTEILNKMFVNVFSVSKLVKAAENYKDLNVFLKQIFDRQPIISKKIKAKYNKKITLSSVKNALKTMDSKINRREENILNTLYELNKANTSIFKVKYTVMDEKDYIFPWEKIVFINASNASKFYKNFGISRGNLLSFLRDISKEKGVWTVISAIIDSNYKVFEVNRISQYRTEDRIVEESNYILLNNEENIIDMAKEIRRLLEINVQIIFREINNYYEEMDLFSLYFNVNNSSLTGHQKENWRKVTEISMGQKVVALLNFVIAYSTFLGETTPFVIDQPEDNLDNTYIYDNLVKILRNIKGSRQVIVASHNSTIVMNSGTEQVFVLKSDSNNGWLDKAGYSSDKKIKKEILSILEGGLIAYQKKMELYKEVLTE